MDQESGRAVLQGVGSALLIGLSGFLYLYSNYLKRFETAHLPPQSRASLSLAYGLFFVSVCAVLANVFPVPSASLSRILISFSPFPGIRGEFLSAPILALVAAAILNVVRLVRFSDSPVIALPDGVLATTALFTRMRIASIAKLADKSEDLLIRTLWRAITKGKLLQVTLKSGKVYIGLPLASMDPSTPSSWLRIVPIASGYRDKNRQTYVPTTYYGELIDANGSSQGLYRDEDLKSLNWNGDQIQFDAKDIGILVAWSEVLSLTIHNPALEAYFARDESTQAQDYRTIFSRDGIHLNTDGYHFPASNALAQSVIKASQRPGDEPPK